MAANEIDGLRQDFLRPLEHGHLGRGRVGNNRAIGEIGADDGEHLADGGDGNGDNDDGSVLNGAREGVGDLIHRAAPASQAGRLGVLIMADDIHALE